MDHGIVMPTTQDSVYGKRDGALVGLAIVRRDSRSLCFGSRGWRTGCVHNVRMIGRQDMYKPEPLSNYFLPHDISSDHTMILYIIYDWTIPFCQIESETFTSKIFQSMPGFTSKETPSRSQAPHLGRAFTDVQELKQVSEP